MTPLKSTLRTWTAAAALAAALAGLAPAALAQDAEGPSPDEILEKVKEVDRLMKQAETSLAKALDGKASSEDADALIEKLLDQKSREQADCSASELRDRARSGSKEAQETLAKLIREATKEVQAQVAKRMEELAQGGQGSRSASEGIRKVLENGRSESAGVSKGIQWLLDNATSRQGNGPNSPPQQREQEQQDKPKQNPDKADQDKPESETEPPSTPEAEKWLADLPPQVRKAYETRDWDSIPVRWRRIIKLWTLKMRQELDKENER